jgi:pilus assembly protein CpaE
MTVSVPDPTSPIEWGSSVTAAEPVVLVVSSAQLVGAEWINASVQGHPIEVVVAELDADGEIELPARAMAAIVEVSETRPLSLERFKKLGEGGVPLVAAAYAPPLAFIRQLIRLGAHDVIPLPLERIELENAIAPIRAARAREAGHRPVKDGKLVAVIKSDGGVGATAILGQLAQRFAAEEGKAGRGAALIDFDIQFGDAAFQLGLQPRMTLSDLIAARGRIDGDMLRATATPHPSGLQVIAAPAEILPLESIDSDTVVDLIDVAKTEFGTVFIDLPTNWTNWSLSLLAHADLVLLVSQLSIPSLHRARRQLDLLAQQISGNGELRLVLNRFEKKMFGALSGRDVEKALGREADFTIANDYEAVSEAIERGVPVAEIRRKGALARDLNALDESVAALLGRVR